MSELLATAVRTARLAKGHTFADAAAVISGIPGKPGSLVQRWEDGKVTPSAAFMPALADYCGLDVATLDGLARGIPPEGRRDADVEARLDRIIHNMEILTRRQLNADSELRKMRAELTELQTAMVETLRKRL